MTTETWLPFPLDGLGGNFLVSSSGRVKAIHGRHYSRVGQIMKCWYTRTKRAMVPITVRGRGIKRHYQVARLVALAFIPNPDCKPEVNHKDGNPANNRVVNLEWVTRTENIAHAIAHGLLASGQRNGNSTLTDADVRGIIADGVVFPYAVVAAKYSVHTSVVALIVQGKAWRHIPRPDGYDAMRRKAYAQKRAGHTRKDGRWTETLVRELRSTYTGARGERQQWARRVGVSVGSVAQVLSGLSWKHVPMPPY